MDMKQDERSEWCESFQVELKELVSVLRSALSCWEPIEVFSKSCHTDDLSVKVFPLDYDDEQYRLLPTHLEEKLRVASKTFFARNEHALKKGWSHIRDAFDVHNLLKKRFQNIQLRSYVFDPEMDATLISSSSAEPLAIDVANVMSYFPYGIVLENLPIGHMLFSLLKSVGYNSDIQPIVPCCTRFMVTYNDVKGIDWIALSVVRGWEEPQPQHRLRPEGQKVVLDFIASSTNQETNKKRRRPENEIQILDFAISICENRFFLMAWNPSRGNAVFYDTQLKEFRMCRPNAHSWSEFLPQQRTFERPTEISCHTHSSMSSMILSEAVHHLMESGIPALLIRHIILPFLANAGTYATYAKEFSKRYDSRLHAYNFQPEEVWWYEQ